MRPCRLRFALIGCGKITERLALPQLKACPDVDVTALVDKRRAAAARLADQFGIDRRRIWTDWKRMLREAEVDAVAVNLPNVLHAEVAIAALEAKKHVMVEKPMALTLAEADAMVEAARTHRRFLMVEHTQRFHPAHEVAYDLLQRGTLGTVTQVRGRIGHAGPEHWSGTPRSWFTDKRQSGGGALFDVGIHIVDVLRWLSGKQVRRICCQAKTLQKRVKVEDNASALLEFTDGTLGSFEASWTTRPYEVTTVFYGERGQLRTAVGAVHPVVIKFCQRTGDPNKQIGDDTHPAVPASSRRGGAYPCFIDSIAKGRAPVVPGEEGCRTLEVILGAYESVRSGRWVDLPLRHQGKH
jgi:predicted dehydrogenase